MSGRADELMTPTRFGAFIAPDHSPRVSHHLQLERDIELVCHMDRLGFDEAWIGEHHSSGYETIASPEVFIAAAARETRHIRLGSGVNSLSYHHPFILADRFMQLDHQTRGRVMMGAGPGELPSDAYMMGIDSYRQRRMMTESLECIVALLRGEIVTRKTDWFELRDARSSSSPSPDGIDSQRGPHGSRRSPGGVRRPGHQLGGVRDHAAAAGLHRRRWRVLAHAPGPLLGSRGPRPAIGVLAWRVNRASWSTGWSTPDQRGLNSRVMTGGGLDACCWT